MLTKTKLIFHSVIYNEKNPRQCNEETLKKRPPTLPGDNERNLQWQNFRHMDGKETSGGDLGTEYAAYIPQPMGAGCSRTHPDLRELDGNHTNLLGQEER